MGNFTYSAVIVLSLHVILAIAQMAILDLNPNSNAAYFSCQGSLFERIVPNGTSCANLTAAQIDTTDISSKLPTTVSNDQGSSSSGNIFVDGIGTIASWFKSLGSGIADALGFGYLKAFITAPYNLIKGFGLPDGFTFLIGGMWYLIEILLVTAFIMGRND